MKKFSGKICLGTEVSGYHVHEYLGRGIFGEVYRVSWGDTDEEYVLKLLDSSFCENEKFTQKITEILQIKSNLNLKSCVRTCDVGYDDNIFWVCNDYYNQKKGGVSIHENIKNGNILSSEFDLYTKLSILADDIEMLHDNGIYHGNLKLSNILVGDEQLYLSDTGFVQAFGFDNFFKHLNLFQNKIQFNTQEKSEYESIRENAFNESLKLQNFGRNNNPNEGYLKDIHGFSVLYSIAIPEINNAGEISEGLISGFDAEWSGLLLKAFGYNSSSDFKFFKDFKKEFINSIPSSRDSSPLLNYAREDPPPVPSSRKKTAKESVETEEESLMDGPPPMPSSRKKTAKASVEAEEEEGLMDGPPPVPSSRKKTAKASVETEEEGLMDAPPPMPSSRKKTAKASVETEEDEGLMDAPPPVPSSRKKTAKASVETEEEGLMDAPPPMPSSKKKTAKPLAETEEEEGLMDGPPPMPSLKQKLTTETVDIAQGELGSEEPQAQTNQKHFSKLLLTKSTYIFLIMTFVCISIAIIWYGVVKVRGLLRNNSISDVASIQQQEDRLILYSENNEGDASLKSDFNSQVKSPRKFITKNKKNIVKVRSFSSDYNAYDVVGIDDLTDHETGAYFYKSGSTHPFTGIVRIYYDGGEVKSNYLFEKGIFRGFEIFHENGELLTRNILKYLGELDLVKYNNSGEINYSIEGMNAALGGVHLHSTHQLISRLDMESDKFHWNFNHRKNPYENNFIRTYHGNGSTCIDLEYGSNGIIKDGSYIFRHNNGSKWVETVIKKGVDVSVQIWSEDGTLKHTKVIPLHLLEK